MCGCATSCMHDEVSRQTKKIASPNFQIVPGLPEGASRFPGRPEVFTIPGRHPVTCTAVCNDWPGIMCELSESEHYGVGSKQQLPSPWPAMHGRAEQVKRANGDMPPPRVFAATSRLRQSYPARPKKASLIDRGSWPGPCFARVSPAGRQAPHRCGVRMLLCNLPVSWLRLS